MQEELMNQQEPAAQTSEQPEQAAQGGQADEAAMSLAKRAQEFIYMDAGIFDSLVKSLQNEGQETAKTIGMAAAAILDKMEESEGEIDTDTLQKVGQVIVGELLELSVKAGATEEVNKETFQDALGETYAVWMKRHPERVDRNAVEQAMQSPEAQEMMQRKGLDPAAMQQQQPAQPQPAQGGGLIEGAM